MFVDYEIHAICMIWSSSMSSSVRLMLIAEIFIGGKGEESVEEERTEERTKSGATRGDYAEARNLLEEE